jgi:hypothetical protein
MGPFMRLLYLLQSFTTALLRSPTPGWVSPPWLARSRASRTRSFVSTTSASSSSAPQKEQGQDEAAGPVDMSNPSAAYAAMVGADATPLPAEKLLSFERRGFITQHGLFTAEEVAQSLKPVITRALELRVEEMWKHSTRVMLGDEVAFDDFGEALTDDVGEWMDALEDVELPFLQAFNCWRHFPAVDALVRSPRLAATAAQLLGVERVRLYQDSLFLKRPGDGPTRWHSDLHMVSQSVSQSGRQAGSQLVRQLTE